MATKHITLKLIVDKSHNRVLFAESNSHFVEIILSFLTLPLGSIIRLTNKQPVGSLHKLYQSVENLDSGCLQNEACRSMLLRPLNPAAKRCSSLPITYDDNSFSFCYGFICSDRSCSDGHVRFYPNACHRCGRLMYSSVRLGTHASVPARMIDNAHVFIISDDLVISQSSTEKTIEMLPELDIEQWAALEYIHVDVKTEKIIELLKRLLVSDTPLTDVFLGGRNENKIRSSKQPGCQTCNETAPRTAYKKIPVKLLLNQDDNKLLFVEADNEFTDLLVSFLTYPMSSVVKKLGGKSGIQCFDNLYNCIESLRSAKCFDDLIEILVTPKLPPFSSLENQLIELDELTLYERYYMCRTDECQYDVLTTIPNSPCKGCQKITNKRLTPASPRSCSGGFMGRASFMVTDDLIINKLSPATLVTEILKMAPGRRITPRNVEIGEHEALALLRACLTTKNVLTDALVGNQSGGERSGFKSA